MAKIVIHIEHNDETDETIINVNGEICQVSSVLYLAAKASPMFAASLFYCSAVILDEVKDTESAEKNAVWARTFEQCIQIIDESLNSI